MTPSLNKCPRCGTLRPSGEVAHTCVARDPADTGTSREGDPYAEIAALKADLARAVELLREIGKWERMFDDPDARMVVTKIDAFLAERGGEAGIKCALAALEKVNDHEQ